MRGMTGEHRAAARLRDVTDEQAGPAVLCCIAGQFFQKTDHARMTPAAVARKAHDLPVRSIRRQCHSTGEASFGIKADGLRLLRQHRKPFTAESLFGRHVFRHGHWREVGRDHCGQRSCKNDLLQSVCDHGAVPCFAYSIGPKIDYDFWKDDA